jgi:hypothetical protein
MLKGVELGTAALDAFITKQETFIRDQVAKANSGAVSIAGGKEATPVSTLHKCMACGMACRAGRPSARGNSGGVAATSPRASRPIPT